MTYSASVLFFSSAYDTANVIAKTFVANFLTFKEVLSYELADFLFCCLCKAILFNVKLNDPIVSKQTSLESFSIALIYLVARDVKTLDVRIVTDILR